MGVPRAFAAASFVLLACGSRTGLEGAGPTEGEGEDAAIRGTDAGGDSGGDAGTFVKCVSGAAPQQLATGATKPQWLWVDDSWAYFARDQVDGSVWKVSTRDGTLVSLVTLNSVAVFGGAVDATALYLCIGDGEIVRVPSTGGTATTLAKANYPPLAGSLAIDSDTVFFADYDVISRVPKAGGNATQLPIPSLSGFSAALWAADGTNVYYSKAASTWAFDLAGTQLTSLPVCSYPPAGMVLDASGIYATSGLEVRALAAGATQSVALARFLRDPGALVTDDSSVYWIDNGTVTPKAIGGRVMRVAKTGGTATLLASFGAPISANQAPPIAVDDQCVYWIDGGALMRVAK